MCVHVCVCVRGSLYMKENKRESNKNIMPTKFTTNQILNNRKLHWETKNE